MKRRTLWVNLAIGAVIVVVLGLIVTSLRSAPPPQDQKTVTVERADVTATVTASGTVERAGVVELIFATGGTVTSVDVAPGDAVATGAVLATVDDTTALQQLASAESTLAQAVQSAASTDASISSASAAVTDAQRIARETNKRNRLAVDQARESLAVAEDLWDEACLDPGNATCPNPSAQAQLRAAQASVDSAQRTFDTAVENAANNAIGYDVAVNQAGEVLTQRHKQERSECHGAGAATTACASAQTATVTARQAHENAIRARTTGLLADQQAQLAASLSLASANVSLQRAQVDLRKAGDDAVRSARQALDSAERVFEQGKASGEQSVRSAQSALTSALASQATIELADGGEVTPAEAAIAAAQTGVAVAQAAVEDTQLVSPVSGIVGTVPYVVGSLATAATGGITVIPEGPLEVVADFAESDASGIEVGASASVTFDALAGAESDGTVVAVDPVATTSNSGLVTYRVRVQVTDAPDTVREGMTASVAVLVAESRDTLVVPQAAIAGSGDRASVLVSGADGVSTSVPVTIGLQGDNGTEILGGVDEGDVLVIPSAEDVSFPDGGVPGSGRDDDPDGPFGGGGD
ncbi:MAG: efflux RND transporter periplasmic adaptor subunit [Candidatus Nanopelagicales bacterium]